MNLYMKQKVFSLKDKFYIYDEEQNPVYYLEGKMFSIHGKHYLYDMNGNEAAYIHKKIIALLPKYFIELPNGKEYEMKGKLAFAHEVFAIEELGWKLTGKFLEHDYTITQDNNNIATMHQKWLSWGDTYEIAIAEGADPVIVIAAVLCIDMLHQEEEAASMSSDTN